MVDVVISVAGAVAGKVVEQLVDPIVKRILYPFKYNGNIEKLTEKVEEVKGVSVTVLHEVEEAKSQGYEIEEVVKKWLNSVDVFANGVAKPIIDDQVKAGTLCSIGFCPNLMTRYSLSKRADKATKDGIDLLALRERTWKKVSYKPHRKKSDSLRTRDYEAFGSRKTVFDDLMQTLRDADVNLIGVWGMGGVGKSTLVREVVAQAIQDKLFDEVVIVELKEHPFQEVTTVSARADQLRIRIENIQAEIAEQLGLIPFQEVTVSARADRLRYRLKRENRVLIVLDNVWEKLDLESIGIPLRGDEKVSIMQMVDQEDKYDNKPLRGDEKVSIMQTVDHEDKYDNKRQCKILLTSRNLNMLRTDMDIPERLNFKVEILSEAEAEDLFWKTLGSSDKKSDLNPTAVEIVRKCDGLPIAIKTIAKALKYKNLDAWKDALDQLKKGNPKNITGVDKDGYNTIELSFEYLDNEDAKSLFLLCSLCNAGGGICIDDLLKYSMGLGLFQGVDTLIGGRTRLAGLIDHLKNLCLLMDDDDNRFVKMHDVIHAVAVPISSTTKLWFNLQDSAGHGLKEMIEKQQKDSVALSLPYRDISELPERMEFPNLELFLLYKEDASLQIPDAVFEGMKGLKVLDMSGIHLLSPPPSLGSLTNLHTLCLDRCQLEDVAIIGKLKELEVLSFHRSEIEQLPIQIGQLTRLKLLDLSNCSKLKVIESNVISSLTCLEELYMGDSFDQWEGEGRNNASPAELKELSSLKTLDIHVPNAHIIPQDLSLGELDRYRIFIGDVWDWSGKYETSKTLKLKLSSSSYLSNGIRSLLNRAEDVYLDELKGIKNVLYELDEEGFPQLKHLHVQNGPEVQYIINSGGFGPSTFFPKLESMFLHNLINLEKMCHDQLATEAFSKLRIMKVGKCDRLKHLFSFSMAKNLLKLEEIEVTDCKKLEEIIFEESGEQVHQNKGTSGIEFSQLHTLRLQCLPQLTSFGFINAFTPNTRSQEILAEDEVAVFMSSFGQNVSLPSLKKLKLSSINIECMWLDQLPTMSSCCPTLTSLTLEECSGNLKFLFSYSVVTNLELLEKLKIRNCKSIEGIIYIEELRGEGGGIKMVFPKLIELQLKGLPNLTKFSSENSAELPSLTRLSIQDCPKLKTFSSAAMSAEIKPSKEVEEMICLDDIHPLFDQKVVLPTLASLNMSSIPIQTIWHNQLQPVSSCFQNLTEIFIYGCDTLKYVFSSSMVESFIKLEVLEISDCKFMEVAIITHGERISDTLFPKLYQLELNNLPELTSFYNFEGKPIDLPSLAQLWIENCPKMHTFVSNSPHADILVLKEEQLHSEENLHSHIKPFFDEKVRIPNLKVMRIEKMDNMRRIWHHQLIPGSFSKIESFGLYDCHNLLNVFPSNMLTKLHKLESLWVSRCDSLEKIFEDPAEDARSVFLQLTWMELTYLPSLRSVYPGWCEWPKLKKLTVWRCNKVEILTSEFSITGKSQLENSVQEPPFIYKVAFPKVEELSLEWNWIVKVMLHGKFSEYSSNLKVLELVDVSKESSLCPCCFLCTLPNLEKLYVDFGFFEELFICEGLDCKEKHVETLSKLSQLKLYSLKDSLYMWEENSLPYRIFRNLKTLEVLNCDNLKNLVPSVVSFQNLTTLEVSKCNGLVNLLVDSVAKSLVQLTRLKIIECRMIEEIITHCQDGEMEDRIIFTRLKYLALQSLPKLTRFCSRNYTIEFLSLQQVVVLQCPNMKIFSQGTLNTPRLHKLQITEAEDEGYWEGDLDTTIQKMSEEMVGFRGVEKFTVSDFPHLKEDVWDKQFQVSYFSNLKSLVVDDKCSNLRHIFTPSMAMGLMQLHELKLKNCDILEAISGIEVETIENTLFPNLCRLELIDLPKLACFCNFVGNSIELPSLATLWIVNCPNMQTFISNSTSVDMSTSEENLHTEKQPHFDEKVQLPNLKFLMLMNMDKLRKIWHHQLTSDSFCKIESLRVISCHKVLNVFPSNMFGRLQKLDELLLTNCSSLDEIFELQAFGCGKTQQITATQLRKLKLRALPKLKHIWDMDSQGLLTIQNLLSIEVIECDNLKSIFPAFVGRNLLKLKQLLIQRCGMVEEIFAKEEQVDEAMPSFPQLTRLGLIDLPKLRSFYPGVHILEWPMLKSFDVWNCGKGEICASKFLSFQVTDGEIEHEIPISQPLLLLDKVPFFNLESLGLDWKWFEKEALHEKLPEYSCKLNFLTLAGFQKGADICVYCLLHKLSNLERLVVYQGFFKEVFLCDRFGCEEKHVEAPGYKLNHLLLLELFDSLLLCEENSLSSKVLQNLSILQVDRCGNLKSLVPSSVSFQNLTKLEVQKCNELLNLVAVPTAKSLVQLKNLIVFECKMIEAIIAHDREEVEDQIIFKKLRYLELECLPNLTSFYSGSYTTEFPSLQQVVLRECPNMKIFSRGVLCTPRLHKLQTTKAEGEGFWEGNLNTTIEHLFIENCQSSKENRVRPSF